MLTLITPQIVRQREPDRSDVAKRLAHNQLAAALANYRDVVLKEKGDHLRCYLELSDPERMYFDWLIKQIREHIWGR